MFNYLIICVAICFTQSILPEVLNHDTQNLEIFLAFIWKELKVFSIIFSPIHDIYRGTFYLFSSRNPYTKQRTSLRSTQNIVIFLVLCEQHFAAGILQKQSFHSISILPLNQGEAFYPNWWLGRK